MKKKLFIICILVFQLSATVLGDLAAGMKPGEWKEISTQNFNSGKFLETRNTTNSILSYADKAVWNPHTKQLFFVGSPHYSPYKFAIYSDATNAWTAGPQLPGIPFSTLLVGHGYQQNALNPVNGDLFYRPYNSKTVYKYTYGNNTWKALPNIPSSVQVGVACEYYPEMGGLLHIDGISIHFHNPLNNQWTKKAGQYPIGPYCQIALYNPIHKVLLFGGGYTQNLYKMTSNGQITQLGNAPTGLGVNMSVNTIDPVSGKYLFIKGTSFYEYDIISDSWNSVSAGLPSGVSTSYELVACPISTYGVIMFIKWYYDHSKVYIYKHTKGTTSSARVRKQSDNLQLSVNPNPFKGSARIILPAFGKADRLFITNVSGRIIKEFKQVNGNAVTWHPGRNARGMYLLTLQANHKRMTKKLVVME